MQVLMGYDTRIVQPSARCNMDKRSGYQELMHSQMLLTADYHGRPHTDEKSTCMAHKHCGPM